jgi:hypothetical protein
MVMSKKFLNNNLLNFIVAVCAMLVSIASFYATYLQAESAKQQVKAMTYPLIEYSHGNYSQGKRMLSLKIRNNGVGPAIVKKVEIIYKGQSYQDVMDMLDACCKAELHNYRELVERDEIPQTARILTGRMNDIIIAAQGEIRFLGLERHELNAPLWEQIHVARFSSSLSICYCTLLDDCFMTDGRGKIREVEVCPL